ncbi:uncharacterized protein [Dermacentor andersoni]|uniref:uncharacterized protein isoform X2 n=1 Tax=Dermacentor andersoni TaxID=34620 RepID=UPI00215544D2|nr:uncharacterized protein LOC126538754 [Dermacentor andersoni]
MSSKSSNVSISQEDPSEGSAAIAPSEEGSGEEAGVVDEYLRQVLSLDPDAMEQLSALDQEGTRAPTNSVTSVGARTPDARTASVETLRPSLDSNAVWAKDRSQQATAEVDHKATDGSFSEAATNE